MSDTKHTPGPWTIEDARLQGAWVMSGREVVCYAPRREDAIKFAAALDMLAALNRLVGAYESTFDVSLPASIHSAVVEARAAIAKATNSG